MLEREDEPGMIHSVLTSLPSLVDESEEEVHLRARVTGEMIVP